MVHPGRRAKVTTKRAAVRRVGVMVVRELALTALLLLGVSLVVFVILHLSPGDPFSVLLEGQAPGQGRTPPRGSRPQQRGRLVFSRASSPMIRETINTLSSFRTATRRRENGP